MYITDFTLQEQTDDLRTRIFVRLLRIGCIPKEAKDEVFLDL